MIQDTCKPLIVSTIILQLDKAFTILRQAGYSCHHNIGYTMSQASCIVGDAPKVVFYHGQDYEDLHNTCSCYLAWRGNGSEICKILRDAGLHVEWDSNPDTRIKIGKQSESVSE